MDPFVAEIRIFPFNFAPKGWAWCNGQLLPLSQNTALFSLLGTTYGGDGKSNFALPDLEGRAAMHPGQGPGLSLHDLGETGGSETVTLLRVRDPEPHAHAARQHGHRRRADPVAGAVHRALGQNANAYQARPTDSRWSRCHGQALAPAGGDQPHNNMQPYLTLLLQHRAPGRLPAAHVSTIDTAEVTLRPVTDEDRELLLAVYAASRAGGARPGRVGTGAARGFLRMQFAAQDHEYRRAQPRRLLRRDRGRRPPAGRLYVDRRPGDLRIVDIALLPEFRGRGIGAGADRRAPAARPPRRAGS